MQQCKDSFKTLKTSSIYQIIILKTPFKCKKDAYQLCNCSLLYPSLEFVMSLKVRFLTRAYPGTSRGKIALNKEYSRPLAPPLVGKIINDVQRRRLERQREIDLIRNNSRLLHLGTFTFCSGLENNLELRSLRLLCTCSQRKTLFPAFTLLSFQFNFLDKYCIIDTTKNFYDFNF